MPLFQSRQVRARDPIPSIPAAAQVVPIQAEFVVPAGGIAVNDVVEMHGVPPNVRVLDAVIHNSACGASATAAFGYLSGAYGSQVQTRTCGTEFATGLDMNGTAIKRMTASQLSGPPAPTAPGTTDDMVGWGFRVTGAGWAAGATIRATLYVAAL